MDLTALRAAFPFTPDHDAEAVQVYAQALDSADEHAFGYLELRAAVQRLIGRGMDAQSALDSVLVTAETLGRDRRAMLASTQAHLDTLDREHDQIEAALTKRLSEGLAAEHRAIEQAVARQRELQTQIERLTRELAAAKTEEAGLVGQLEATRARVETQGERLTAVYEILKREISADLATLRTA